MTLIIFLISCSYIAQYDDDEVVASVNDAEITVGELRFLFADKDALDYVESFVQIEVVKQEVQKRNLNISHYLQGEENTFQELPRADTDDEDEKQVRKFAEKQAKKLDLTPEQFQQLYAKKIDENNAYILTYLHDELNLSPDESITDEHIAHQASTDILNSLVKEYEQNIKIFIH